MISKKLILVCLFNFLVAALMGLTMRFAFVSPIDFNYRNLMHAHSHVAMLGWVYLMLYVFIVNYFVSEKQKVFNRLFWLTEFAVVGMMISFPIQGYAAFSISFSTLHIFCSYYFVYLVFKHQNIDSKPTRILLKTALIFMLISTIGVWCLGPAVGLLGQASAFYQIAIQFFLHFQFNGWFLIGLLGLFFHFFNLKDNSLFKHFHLTLVLSTVCTLALPVSWFAPTPILNWINGFGILCQIACFIMFIKMSKSAIKTHLNSVTKDAKYLYIFALISFTIKIIFQSASLFPYIALIAKQNHNFVIGFIHLTMLGVVTGFLFAYIIQSKTTYTASLFKYGVYSFILGFLGTEFMLFFQGIRFVFGIGLIPNYYLLLFILSSFLVLGITLIFISILQSKTNYYDRKETIKTT
ncbi:hypothetical protein [Formosa sp. PL04]|uniref:hypothetical protein n=1 Tax=Formosa sp. PL04 TaxID=3081755 RepID=UPI0029824EAA|nr:hypothetical protein [Formosa sp. PL04]MDW5290672.1 hypothetical protein [Formosa sp. PL04]